MKSLFTALLAASALIPTSAFAQHVGLDVDSNAQVRGDRPDRPERGPRPDRANRPAQERPDRGIRRQSRVDASIEARADRPAFRRGDATDRSWPARNENRTFDRDHRDDRRDYRSNAAPTQQFPAARRDYRADDRVDRRDNRRAAAQGRPGWQNYSAFRDNSSFGDRRYDDRAGIWNRNWRNDDRYDWNRFRSANRGAYRLPRYYAPPSWGYGYRRFSVGVTLSSGLWGRNYWIDDPYAYRLPDAYGPYRWVRYYGDALLIDLRTGQVVDTVYDIFY